MNKKTYTLAELVERSVPYFASNPDAPYLLAASHSGKFYLPEFESYAQHAVDKAKDGEVYRIDRELTLKPEGMSYAEALAEAGLVVPVETPAPTALAEAVASAARFYFPELAAPTSKPEGVNITLDTRPIQKIVDAAVKRVTEAAPAAEAPAKRKYTPRAPKPAAEVATESAPAAPSVRKPRAPKPAAEATATKTKASTKKTK